MMGVAGGSRVEWRGGVISRCCHMIKSPHSTLLYYSVSSTKLGMIFVLLRLLFIDFQTKPDIKDKLNWLCQSCSGQSGQYDVIGVVVGTCILSADLIPRWHHCHNTVSYQ